MMRKIMATAILALFTIGAIANGMSDATEDSNSVVTTRDLKSNNLKDTSFVSRGAANSPLSYEQAIYKNRLDAIQRTIQLDYNEYVQDYINVLASRGKEKISRALGLSKYYFPIYEKIFKEENIPDEMKYLSVVESSLNPHAVSRVGATGLWQFMYTTGKTYGLNIDNWEDERKNPVAASYAAAAYLRDSYDQFGDWLLAIASYNCGSSNVARAIAKAGGEYNYWAIRPYLPRETQFYVPAFIATVYLMNHYKLHNISPQVANFTIQTEVLQVNSSVSFADIARAANLNLNDLSILNPSYRKQIINASPQTPKSLVIPVVDKNAYSSLYNVLYSNGAPVLAKYTIKPVPKNRPLYYKVRKGDSLISIANKYKVEVQDIKVWNNIKQGVIVPGQVLRVSGTESGILRLAGYFTYRVQPGDTLLRIAEKFHGVTVTGLKVVNDLTAEDVKPGMLLKIVKG
jgi:membrane-bound lytic murein transglycosylase D